MGVSWHYFFLQNNAGLCRCLQSTPYWSIQWWHQLGSLLHPQVSWQDCRPPTSHSKLLWLPSGMVHFVHLPQKDSSLCKQSSLIGCTSQGTICSSCPLCAVMVLLLKPFKIICRLKKKTHPTLQKNKYRWTLVYNTDGNEINHAESANDLLYMNRTGSTFCLVPRHFKITVQHLLTWNVSSYWFWADFCRLTPSAYLAVMLWSPQLPRKWCPCHSQRCF